MNDNIIVNVDDLSSFCPSTKKLSEFVENLNKYMPMYEIDTPNRISMFLAQAIHESAGFSRLVENLNYSAKGLMSTWPKRFPTMEFALKFEKSPEKIANTVYADRMGNGKYESGDGYKFRGRGVFQITGKNNYKIFYADNPTLDVLKTPDMLLMTNFSILSACWFWNKNSLNKFADKMDITGCSKELNGGLIGISERTRLCKEFLQKFGS